MRCFTAYEQPLLWLSCTLAPTLCTIVLGVLCACNRAQAMALKDSLSSLSKRWQREAVKQADLVSWCMDVIGFCGSRAGALGAAATGGAATKLVCYPASCPASAGTLFQGLLSDILSLPTSMHGLLARCSPVALCLSHACSNCSRLWRSSWAASSCRATLVMPLPSR